MSLGLLFGSYKPSAPSEKFLLDFDKDETNPLVSYFQNDLLKLTSYCLTPANKAVASFSIL